MACALTQGRSIDCRNSAGGIQEVLISDFDDITLTTVASGVVTAMAQTALSFYTYSLEKENGSLVETHTGTLSNGTNSYAGVLEFSTMNLSASQSEELNILDQKRVFVIVRDMNDIYWTFGAYFGADKLGGTSVTGAAFNDHNGYTYTLSSMEKVRMLEVDASVVALLTVA